MTETRRMLTRTMRIDIRSDAQSGQPPTPTPPGPPPGVSPTAPRVSAAQGSDFRELLESIYDGVLLTDDAGLILDHNARTGRLLGDLTGSFRGRHIASLISGSDDSLLGPIHEALESERYVLIQAYALRADGSMFPAEITVNRLHLGAGSQLCFFLRDIRDREAVQARLRVEHRAVHNAGNGIAILGPDGRLTYGNPALARLWGYDPGEAVEGIPLETLLDSPAEADTLLSITGGGESWTGELVARRVDGRRFFVAVSATPNATEDGRIDGLILSFSDIDARRRAEDTLRRYQSQLEELVAERTSTLKETNARLELEIHERRSAQESAENTRHYLEAIIRASHDGILVCDADGNFEFMNEAAAHILGWPRDQLLGRLFMTCVPPDRHTFMQQRWEEARQGRGAPYETDVVTQAGERRSLMVSHRLMKYGDENKYCLVIKDISDRRRMEDDLRAAILHLEEHDREKTEFVSNVSHELRTPLTSIEYAAENLLDGVMGELPDGARDYLHMMKADCNRLTHTIADILDLSRLEANRLALDRASLPLCRFVQQCAGACAVQAEEAGLSLHVDTPPEVGFILGDSAKLERSICNVIHNALKFTPRGGTVTVAVDRRGQHERPFRIRVTDTGIGIAAEHLPHVTERYYRVGEHVVGTGLGLALCKEIVELHGGRLDIDSPPPGRSTGTLVTMSLPAGPSPLLLLMMPAGASRQLLVRRLADARYDVREHDTPDSLLTDCERAHPDALILDASADEFPTLDLLARLHDDADGRRRPAILMLASENVSDVLLEVTRGLKVAVMVKTRDAGAVPNAVDDLLLRAARTTGGAVRRRPADAASSWPTAQGRT